MNFEQLKTMSDRQKIFYLEEVPDGTLINNDKTIISPQSVVFMKYNGVWWKKVDIQDILKED